VLYASLDAYPNEKVSQERKAMPLAHNLDSRAQDFRHAPGLGHAAAWLMRGIAVEDLGDLPQSGLVDVGLERRQPGLGSRQRFGGTAVGFKLDFCPFAPLIGV
jgi:hypothetical protein